MQTGSKTRHRRHGFFAALLAVATAFVLVSFMDNEPAKPAPRAVGGVIDLTHWDFTAHGRVRLEGEWRYASRWGIGAARDSGARLVEVPGPWPEQKRNSFAGPALGIATYALSVKLPANAAPLSIHTGYVYSAFRMRANGTEIASGGVPSPTKQGETGRVYGVTAPLGEGGIIELEFETSNHIALNGGFHAAPIVALESAMNAWTQTFYALSIFLIGAMFFAACYHLVAFVLAPATPETFWFGAFAALMALRTMLIDPIAPQMLPLLGQDWVWRLDYAATILLLPTVFHFFALSFPKHILRRLSPSLAAVSLALAAIPLLFGAAPGELALKTCEALSLVVMLYLTHGLARASWAGEPGSALGLAGWLMSVVATIHDIMMDNGLIVGPNLIPFGFLAFFMCLSGMMVSRFRHAYREVTESSRQMKVMNTDLEAAVEERTRELQRAKVEAESASTAKSHFLATMSHELRTPLNAILGFAELMRIEALGPVGTPRYKEYLSDIHSSGSHLLSLINDILDLSQIEAGKRVLHGETIVLSELADQALAIAASRDRRAKESVTLALADGLPDLRADRRAVLQMLVNLITNALKFTPPGKAIRVEATRRTGGGLTLAVKDEGIGMAPEDIPKALSLFAQVDEGHGRRHEGTGLGLPIVKSLMELHGGTLTLSSEKNKGTTAILDFPAARTSDKDRAAA